MCLDVMNAIPNNKPVAFRMPCCDSLNTVSPRFFTEIFNKTTKKGNFLQIDSSVFNVFTSNDPDLPKALVQNADGSERFRKYLPKDRTYVNYIEDYPYPYVIGRLCWQFPCVTPSDWLAQHHHKPNNPQTVKDWKAALDCTVIKKGVFCLVFHPHGWIRNDQVVDLIDYAAAKYGKKVKFLNFREALERLNKNLFLGKPLREAISVFDMHVREEPVKAHTANALMLDLNNDSYMDVVIPNSWSRVWSNGDRSWQEIKTPNLGPPPGFGILGQPQFVSRFGAFLRTRDRNWFLLKYDFNGKEWALSKEWDKPVAIPRLLDLDNDGNCELLIGDRVLAWSIKKKELKKLPFQLPAGLRASDSRAGLRFLDLDGDGKLDIIFSNEKEYGIYLFKDMTTGWSRKVMAGKREDKDALPMISRNGTNNGFWVHSGSLWWSNEDTVLMKDHVDRRSIKELLKRKKD
jgi:hypothetical protein